MRRQLLASLEWGGVSGADAITVTVDSDLYVVLVELYVNLWSDIHQEADAVQRHLGMRENYVTGGNRLNKEMVL